MAYPPGLLLRTVQYGPVLNSAGKPAKIIGQVSADTSIHYDPSDVDILNDPLPVTSDSAGVITFPWPRSDQPFLSDGVGNTIVDFTSTLSFEFIDSSMPALGDITFLNPGGTGNLVLQSDLSVTRTAGIVASPPSEGTALRAEQAAAEAEAAAASVNPGAPNGTAQLDANGRVIDSSGKQQMQKDSLVWIATEHGITVNAGTGTPQQANINAACVALSAAGGGTIKFPAGVYTTTGSITGADNVTLEPVSPGTATLLKDNVGAAHLIYVQTKTNFHVRNFILDCGPRTYGTGTPNCIRIVDCSYSSIENNTILRGSRTVRVQSLASAGACHDVKILNNTFSGTHRDIAVEVAVTTDPAQSPYRSRSITVDGNTFEDISKASPALDPWSAVYFSGVDGGSISGNTTLASADTAYMVAGASDGIILDGNTALTQQVCVYVGGGSINCQVIDSVKLTSSNDVGISFHARSTAPSHVGNHLCRGNVIVDCARNGILVEAVSNVLIAENVVTGAGKKRNVNDAVGSVAVLIYGGAVAYTMKNTGSTTIYYGGSGVTTGTGTPVAPGGNIPYTPNTPLYAITAAPDVGIITRTLPNQYTSAIGAQALEGFIPDLISIFNNQIALGGSPGGATGITGIRTANAITNLAISGNNVDSQITNQYSFVDPFGASSHVLIPGRTDGKLYVADGTSFYPVTVGAAATPS